MPEPPPDRLIVIGDSLSAGIGGEAVLWPELVAERSGGTARNFAVAGATAASALKQVDRLTATDRLTAADRLVVIEIGGNDLLGGTPAATFERDLNRLLAAVCSPGRTVVMFELPLPPFHDAYGRAQRDAATRAGVALIPKRVLIDVLTADGATVDGLHLSRRGHERLATAVARVIGSGR